MQELHFSTYMMYAGRNSILPTILNSKPCLSAPFRVSATVQSIQTWLWKSFRSKSCSNKRIVFCNKLLDYFYFFDTYLEEVITLLDYNLLLNVFQRWILVVSNVLMSSGTVLVPLQVWDHFKNLVDESFVDIYIL